MRGVSSKTIEKARAAKLELKKMLKGHPDVIGIGIGYRERKGKLVDRCCLRVHVIKKFLLHLLDKDRLLPEEINGVDIDVMEGNYFFQDSKDPKVYHRTIQAGVQIANHTNYPGVGTLGCLPRDAISDNYLILSNWHVLYGRSDASDNEPVVQPLRSGNRNVIGHTLKGIINEKVDCAVAFFDSYRDISENILGIPGRISGYKSAELKMKVSKSGVNGVAKGLVDEIDLDITILTPIAIEFKDQVHIKPVEGEVDDGDSGCVWIAEDDNKAVALHMAGIKNTKAIANHFTDVINAFENEGIYLEFNES